MTNDHIIFVPPDYDDVKEFREKKSLYRSKRDGSRRLREVGDDVTTSPDKRSHSDKKYSADYTAVVTVQLGNWRHNAGKLYYTKSPSGGVPYVAIIIPIGGFIVLVVLLSYVGLKLVSHHIITMLINWQVIQILQLTSVELTTFPVQCNTTVKHLIIWYFGLWSLKFFSDLTEILQVSQKPADPPPHTQDSPYAHGETRDASC